jgi:hypothetical protein
MRVPVLFSLAAVLLAQEPRAAAPRTAGPDSQYQLGPDSLPREGVPKGEIRGPYNLPSAVFPGTSHTWWVYVPVQYDAATPASLMIFNDGQYFKYARATYGRRTCSTT